MTDVLDTRVTKRDGKLQSFDKRKIRRAMLLAFHAVNPDTVPNVDPLVESVVNSLAGLQDVSIEQIQDTVERVLMNHEPEVAKSYILYRHTRTKLRQDRLKPDASALPDYIHVSKYAGYLPDEQRRELYGETVARSRDMHIANLARMQFVHMRDMQHSKRDLCTRCVGTRADGSPIKFTVEDAVLMNTSRRMIGHANMSEVYNEVVERRIRDAFQFVDRQEVLPSMRSMQFGGRGINRNNIRMYNCSWTLANRLRVFGEIFECLLAGSGVGVSVQFQHVAQLPPVLTIDGDVEHYDIPDSIEGWADAVNKLVESYFVTGRYIEFGYKMIRKKGELLSTGGRAPGHVPLRRLLERLRSFLDARSGRQLRPIEVYDMVCWIAEAVLSGGIRRSSLIVIFSVDDSEMMYAKAHGNFRPANGRDPGLNNQRQMSNNSAACLRGVTTFQQLERIIRISKDWGDPGFYWTNDLNFGCNPCGEIGMYAILGDGTVVYRPAVSSREIAGMVTTPGPYVDRSMKFDYHKYGELGLWRDAEDTGKIIAGDELIQRALEMYGHNTGFQFCNLCETNVAKARDRNHFFAMVKAAATIGTCQAAYTNFPYLGPVTELIVKRESLLGVGLMGIMDNPEIGLDPGILREAAAIAVETNKEMADLLGIPHAARVTTVKPGGTAPLEVKPIAASGITRHHAPRYFRRVTANPEERPAQYFKSINPHMVEEKPNGDWSICFPIEAPSTAKYTKDESALEMMDDVFMVYENWVVPGTVKRSPIQVDGPDQYPEDVGPELTHNVSCTVTVKADEWDAVIQKVWDNRHRITAMSFIGDFSDKAFPFAPREAVSTPADEAKWQYLIGNYRPVDWAQYREVDDGTTRQLEVACAGGACEV